MVVGRLLGQIVFQVDREAASSTSKLFRAVSTREDDLSLSSSPQLSNCLPAVLLPNQDPAVFRMYEQWLGTKPLPQPLPFRPGECSAEPWFSLAAHACVLGSRLRAPDFERYALSHLVQNCAAMGFGPWKSIEDAGRWWRRPRALERFGNHWVAWNCSLVMREDGTLPPGSEYIGLRAAALLGEVTRDGTPDPRLVELDHWFEACGDSVAPECLHNPRIRQLTEEEAFATAARLARELRREEEESSSGSYMQECRLRTGSA